MSIFKNLRIDLKIQYIIIIYSLDLVKWSRMVYIVFLLKIAIKSSHKRRAQAWSGDLFAKDIPNK